MFTDFLSTSLHVYFGCDLFFKKEAKCMINKGKDELLATIIM